MRHIMIGFRGLLDDNDCNLLADENITTMIDTHAPLGLKKKIISVDPQNNPSLLPDGLSSYRPLQDADQQFLLDELGEYLRNTEGFKIGHSFDNKLEITALLNKVVGHFYRELSKLVATLDAEELLEWLLTHHEAIVHEQAHNRLTLPTRIACYSSDDKMVAELKKEYPLSSRTALSSRFLIEYVAAQPPSGKRMMTLPKKGRAATTKVHNST